MRKTLSVLALAGLVFAGTAVPAHAAMIFPGGSIPAPTWSSPSWPAKPPVCLPYLGHPLRDSNCVFLPPKGVWKP
jgi:hypothetical protein